MDNLRAHKAVGIRQSIKQMGAQLLYLPPYSPDLSPIEGCWSTLKTYLRQAKARTHEALDVAITKDLALVTAADARAWFAHVGMPYTGMQTALGASGRGYAHTRAD
jgi:hypothetical protein